ncbi:hypothetical protein KAW64_08540 [bacterium]|nr:hypothetical protein [bacterium]
MTLAIGNTDRRRRAGVAIIAWLVLVCAGLAACGCARHVPLAELGTSGAVVGVRLTTSDGEQVTGRVISLDAGSMVVGVRHVIAGDVRVRGRGDERELYSGTERVPGRFVRVDTDEGERTAVVYRTFRAVDITSATFHQSSGERSLSSIVSLLLGPVVGGALGFVL